MIQSDIPVDTPLDTIGSIPSVPTQSIDIMSLINISYILCTVITIYFVIKSIESARNKPVTTYFKSGIVVLIGCIYAIIFNITCNIDRSTLLLSFVLSTFGYDLIIKPLLRKAGINYKDYKITHKPITK